MSTKPILIGGKLKLKGTSSGSSKKRKVSEPESAIAGPTEDKKPKSADATIAAVAKTDNKSDRSSKTDSFLTEAQRRHKQKRLEQETKAAKHLVQTTYRDRIEEFNFRLATTTEHNDIPRISAAGNG